MKPQFIEVTPRDNHTGAILLNVENIVEVEKNGLHATIWLGSGTRIEVRESYADVREMLAPKFV